MAKPIPRTAVVLLLGTAMFGTSATASSAAPADGYVRLAHLSPDTPAVDVYLYPAGGKNAELVLRHVAYGTLSPYQRLGNGGYTVAMRPADAAASTKPVLSTQVMVHSGQAYTVAGMGPYKGIKLDVLDDSATVSAGMAGLRVIAASAKETNLGVKVNGRTVLAAVPFGTASGYQAVAPRTSTVKIGGASTTVRLAAGSNHTIVVLDGTSGLRLLDLPDSTAGAQTPKGGVNTGLGGLATVRSPGPGPVAAFTIAGLVVLFGGGVMLMRTSRSRR
ncbi:MAG: LPXTG-motif cell wall anchor protein [Actinomycetia bacterium]|nr:LPXTG-motif cell wall anchor protein [Actinomycetes bacterium]